MKTTSSFQLRVRTMAQKIMLDDELMGQISDGMWENTHPQDHWQPWCDATVVVDPENLGRNFWCPKDNYQINSSELLSIVGDRMLGYVIAGGDAHPDPAKATPGFTWAQMRKELADLRKIMKTFNADMPPKPTHDVEELRHYSDGDSIAVITHQGYKDECYSCLQEVLDPPPCPECGSVQPDCEPGCTTVPNSGLVSDLDLAADVLDDTAPASVVGDPFDGIPNTDDSWNQPLAPASPKPIPGHVNWAAATASKEVTFTATVKLATGGDAQQLQNLLHTVLAASGHVSEFTISH